ncbi:MAG: universal stress protein [Flavobacterium sp.]|nr:MAG: universal stress protein [Flavobacterium sp.]
MKKILFPTDFSKASLNAFVYALHFASRIHAEVVTLHVYQLPVGAYTDYYDYLTENYNTSELGQFENFKSEVPRLRAIAEEQGLGHVKLSHMLEMGDAVDTILSAQMTERADYLILGTKGASGVREIFLGSVAEEIMNKATCIVLAIPEACAYHPIKNILFLTEFAMYLIGTLERVKELADLFKANILALEVKKNHEEDDERVLQKWRANFKVSGLLFNILASSSIEDTVTDVVELEKMDMIAMAVRHKGFFERLFQFSLSRNLAYHSKIPVLSIPKEVADHEKLNPKKAAKTKSPGN